MLAGVTFETQAIKRIVEVGLERKNDEGDPMVMRGKGGRGSGGGGVEATLVQIGVK